MDMQERDQALDVVRALAIVMVLLVHSASGGLVRTPDSADWWAALLWGGAVRPAVPLFFMCSGALMLSRELSLKRLLTHNLPRILCAMFFWAFLYHVASLAAHGALSPAELLQAVKDTLLFRHEFHFYYLHILLLLYAFVPIAGAFARRASHRELEYALVVWALTGVLLPLLQSFWPFTLISPIASWWRMPMGYASIGYALLGFYLRQYAGTIRRGWYVGAMAVGALITFGGTAAASLQSGALDQRFLEGMSPGPMLMAFAWFGLILSRKKELSSSAAAVTRRLSCASFCIYLSHILFLKLFPRIGFDPNASPTLLFIPLTAALMLLCGWLTWEVLHRIPVVRRYLV